MKFESWAPVYESILEDFGYDRSADERVRDRLAELATPFDDSQLRTLFEGASVAIAGAAPTLSAEIDRPLDVDVIVAASSAADVLLDEGLDIDLMVTDLDKVPETAVSLSTAEVPVAVHAHGDNGPAIDHWVPEFDDSHLLPTTQARPVGPVANYGGFTDGDRGAFLADHFGAASLAFPGWDFDDPTIGGEKARKLAWAERLLAWLESRRSDRFAVLDARRQSIDQVRP